MKEVIRKRRSVRSYDGKEITENHEQLIQAYLSNPEYLTGIFGNTIRIYLNKAEGRKSEKIGTYGIVKNAPAYLVTVSKTSKEALLDCGYVFEKLVLYLESIGLNTCWIGGTFNRDAIRVVDGLGNDEMIPIISPVGYGAHKSSLIDKTFRRMAKSDQRSNFDNMFFAGDFNRRIEEDSTREILQYVRLAPSASNQQPWRIVMGEDGKTHFYIERTPNYGRKLPYDIQMVDIGIAIAHYEMMVGPLTHEVRNPGIAIKNEMTSYVVSVKARK